MPFSLRFRSGRKHFSCFRQAFAIFIPIAYPKDVVSSERFLIPYAVLSVRCAGRRGASRAGTREEVALHAHNYYLRNG